MGRDWRILAALFLMSRVVGVLPVEWNTHINYSLHLCGRDKDCMSPSRRWKFVTIMQLLCFIYSGCRVCSSLPWQLLKTFFGSVFLLSNGSTICSILLVLFHQPKVLIQCCCMACKIYTVPSKQERGIPVYLFILLCVYPFVTIFYLMIYAVLFHLPFRYFFRLLSSNYLYTPIAAIEVVVVVFCFISSRAFMKINKDMQKLKTLNKSTFKHLRSQLDSHIFVSKFGMLFSEQFSPQFLNIFLIYIFRMIWFAVTVIDKLKAGQLTEMLPYAFHASYASGRLFFLCHWCQKVVVEQNETLVSFRHIRIRWIDQTSPDQEVLLDGYEEMMFGHKVEFSACGMFPINMRQILNVLTLIVTYSLVGLQTK